MKGLEIRNKRNRVQLSSPLSSVPSRVRRAGELAVSDIGTEKGGLVLMAGVLKLYWTDNDLAAVRDARPFDYPGLIGDFALTCVLRPDFVCGSIQLHTRAKVDVKSGGLSAVS